MWIEFDPLSACLDAWSADEIKDRRVVRTRRPTATKAKAKTEELLAAVSDNVNSIRANLVQSWLSFCFGHRVPSCVASSCPSNQEQISISDRFAFVKRMMLSAVAGWIAWLSTTQTWFKWFNSYQPTSTSLIPISIPIWFGGNQPSAVILHFRESDSESRGLQPFRASDL
jgi:hypothetical protein